MEEARNVVLALIFMFVGVLIVGGGADFFLWKMHETTLSAFLRQHPGYFWWPFLSFMVLGFLLAIHLFVDPFFEIKL